MFSMRTTKTNTHTSTGLYFMSIRKLVLFFLKSGLKYYVQQMTLPSQVLCGVQSTCKYKAKLYCVNQNTFANTVSSKLLWCDYKTY